MMPVRLPGLPRLAVPCPAQNTRLVLPSLPPQLDPKDKEVNQWWQAIFVYNAAEPIAEVWLDGQALTLNNWGFWVNAR